MDGPGKYQSADGKDEPYFSPSQSSEPSVHSGVPLFSPLNFSIMPQQTHPILQRGPQIPPRQRGGIHPQVMNCPLPPSELPVLALGAPSAPVPTGQPVLGTLFHGPMVLAQGEVMFDPSTPPPFADRAQMQTPRRNGVLKITNVS
jgi:hypothetical protein